MLITYGETLYPFRTLPVSYSCAESNAWLLDFHKSFQQLSALGDFEMTDEQLEKWHYFQEIIDLDEYDRLNPLHYHLKGRITQIEDDKVRIDWLGGRFSILEYDKTPADFVLYDIDQWFEAVIERDYETGDVIKILDVRTIASPELSSQQEQELMGIA